ncbi:MAG: hypothetical protein ACF8XB_12375, partial [Planctomycetota bacterium JB042]
MASIALALIAAAAGCRDAAREPADPGGASGPGAPADPASEAALRFVDVAAAVGIDWRHDPALSPEKHLPETMAGGGGFVDVDGDGRL